MGEVSRISNVFFDPKAAFADIAQRPSWIVPLVLILLGSVAFLSIFTQRVGWERFMRQQIEMSPRMQQMPADQREKALDMQVRMGPIFGYSGIIVGIPLYYAATAGVLLLIFNTLLGAQLRFKQYFAVMCYASLPGLIFSVLAIGVMFLKSPDDFNLRNPLMFNPGAAMDPVNSPKFLYALASSIDLFTLWTIVLIAIGISAAARRMSFGKALMGVILPWAVWVLVKSGFAGLVG